MELQLTKWNVYTEYGEYVIKSDYFSDFYNPGDLLIYMDSIKDVHKNIDNVVDLLSKHNFECIRNTSGHDCFYNKKNNAHIHISSCGYLIHMNGNPLPLCNSAKTVEIISQC
jgi:hypothetical protein